LADLPKKGHFDDLFGRANNVDTIYNRWTEVEHEPFLGWFFAIVTLGTFPLDVNDFLGALLIPSTLISTVPKKRNTEVLPSSSRERSRWAFYD
jgi:hypothetical protein